MHRSSVPQRRIVRLGDVVENVNDFFSRNTGNTVRYVAGEHIDEGDLRVRRYGLTSDDLVPPTFNRLFKAGDVLFHSRNIKKLAQLDFDGLTGEKLFVLRTKQQDILMQEFLPFLLLGEPFARYAKERWAGSTNKFLNKTPLMAYEFALPPMDEQRRAFAVLSACLGTIDELRASMDALLIVRRSLEIRLLQMDRVPRRKVGDLAKFTSGKSIRVSDLPKNPSDRNPIPVFGGNGISGYAETGMDGVSEPTVVIGRVGQFCGVTSMTSGPCWITDNALYPSRMSSEILPEFLALCLRAANLNRNKLGEYLPLITQEVVHKIEIPVPARSEQATAIEDFTRIADSERFLACRLSGSRSLLLQVINRTGAGGVDGV